MLHLAHQLRLTRLGVRDELVAHASREQQPAEYRDDVDGYLESVREIERRAQKASAPTEKIPNTRRNHTKVNMTSSQGTDRKGSHSP